MTYGAIIEEQKEMPKLDVAIAGVCCSCQKLHPIYTNPHPDPDELGLFGSDESNLYLMARHRTNGLTGPWCEGEGTMPQAIVQE